MWALIEHVVASVSIGAITLTTIFAFVGRRVFEHILQRNVEYLKTELTQAAQINKDRLTSLFQTKFERLLKLYDSTAGFLDAVSGIITLYSGTATLPEQSMRVFSERYVAFTSAVNSARPFLPDTTEVSASALRDEVETSIVVFRSKSNIETFVDRMKSAKGNLEDLQTALSQLIKTL